MVYQDWKMKLPEEFPEASRVWIYQSCRSFTEVEEKDIKKQLDDYISCWISHNRPVKGWGTVLFRQFILIMADDTMDRLCGSAIDDAFRFIKNLDENLSLKLMDRMQMGFIQDGVVRILPMNEVENALVEKRINEDTLFFNNAITTQKELINSWILPVKQSFLWQRFAEKAF